MDPTYSGAYGRLKVSRLGFINSGFADQLDQRDSDEFVKMLGTTSYRKELDALSSLYSMPDVVEVVINAHMMSMIKNATFAMPPLARNFVAAYVSKWDIDNIKTILSSKVLGYTVENTEAFLTVQKGTPVGLFGGGISREDYVKLIEQKDIEGVCNALTRFGYGTILLRYLDDAKKSNDVSPMVLALDTYYYSRLLDSFKFYNGNEGPIMQYVRGLIDIKNVMTVIKCIAMGNKSPKDFLVKGGTIPDSKLIEMSGKSIESIKNEMPFKVDDAFEKYKKDEFMAYFESALRRELYRKYVKAFDSIPLSLETIIGFVLRSEIERDELRAIWLGKYYKISKERIDGMRILKYVIS